MVPRGWVPLFVKCYKLGGGGGGETGRSRPCDASGSGGVKRKGWQRVEEEETTEYSKVVGTNQSVGTYFPRMDPQLTPQVGNMEMGNH